MPRTKSPENASLDVPEESKLLYDRWSERRPRTPIAEIADRADVSVSTATAALNGYRHQAKGEAVRIVVPTDKVLAAIAQALGVTPAELRGVGRDVAVDLLEQAGQGNDSASGAPGDDQSDNAAALAALRARRATIKRVLSVFADEELREELARRESEQR